MGALLHVLSSLIVAFTTNFTVLMVARFFVGLTNLAILVPAVTLGGGTLIFNSYQSLNKLCVMYVLHMFFSKYWTVEVIHELFLQSYSELIKKTYIVRRIYFIF